MLYFAYLLADNLVRVTVNKPFTEAFAKPASGDEVALVPTRPNPLSPPQQAKPVARDA